MRMRAFVILVVGVVVVVVVVGVREWCVSDNKRTIKREIQN